jgi:hypothetical protein
MNRAIARTLIAGALIGFGGMAQAQVVVFDAGNAVLTTPATAQNRLARDLFNGKDLTGWTSKANTVNTVEDGVIHIKPGGGDLWTQERFGDFVLDVDVKVDKGTNSGIFIRTDNIQNWLHSGIEVQVLDSAGKENPGKHDAGAIYDVLQPGKNKMRPAGEWNHYTITAKGSAIQVVLNGEQVVDMELNNWPEAHKNPDGTPNKFNIAYKDMARTGHIGLQEHGQNVWYRNIHIRQLK